MHSSLSRSLGIHRLSIRLSRILVLVLVLELLSVSVAALAHMQRREGFEELLFQRALKLDLQDHATLRLCHMFAAIKLLFYSSLPPAPPFTILSLTLASPVQSCSFFCCVRANTVSPVSYRIVSISIPFINPAAPIWSDLRETVYLRLTSSLVHKVVLPFFSRERILR